MDQLSMEQYLKVLAQNTTALRYKSIHENVHLALDTLATQKVSYAFKAWQIREKCVSVLKEALESNNPSLINIALQGIEHAVFHPDLDGITGEEEWDAMDARIFVLQVLDALKCLPYLNSEQQVQGLKILLGLCCDFVPSFDGELIIKIVQMCLACWHKDKPNNQSAMLQLCAAYTLHTQKFCSASCAKDQVDSDVHGAAESLASQAVEKLANADIANGVLSDKLADVIGLAKFFVQQINRAESDSQKGLYLECLLSVLKTLKSTFVREHALFHNYVRQDLCPTLASVVCLSYVSSKVRPLAPKKFKRVASKPKNGTVTRSSMLHRKVALLSVELVRLVGCVASLRPHVAVVFTHLLSPPACSEHGVPFLILKQLLSKPDILCDLAGPFLIRDVSEKQNHAAILQLIIHSMLTSCDLNIDNNNVLVENIQSSITAINTLLATLGEARTGKGLREEQISIYFRQCEFGNEYSDDSASEENSEDVVVTVNGRDADKQSETSDPVVNGDKNGSGECSDGENVSSDIEVPTLLKHHSYLSEDDDIWLSSEDLHAPSPCYQSANEDNILSEVAANECTNNDGHVEKRLEMSHTSTDTASEDSDGDIQKYMEEAVLPSENQKNASHDLIESAEQEKHKFIAQRHVTYLAELLPQLLQCRNVAILDQVLQQAASQFCHEIYATWKVDSVPIQADSLYTLSHSILLLTLRLHLSGHYENSGSHLPCVKSQWVASQQSSGVYLSKAWLSETFRQIIITDLFSTAGFSVANGEVSPLITTLSEIDGIVKTDYGTYFLRDSKSSSDPSCERAARAGAELARQVAVSTWSLILNILRFPFGHVQGAGGGNISQSLHLVFSPSSLRARSFREHDCIVSSVEGLRCAVKLSCALEIQSYSGSVLAQMVEVSIPDDFTLDGSASLDAFSGTEEADKTHGIQLHMCQALCMDAVLDVAFEIGNHSPARWEALFRVISFVACLESLFFEGSRSGDGMTDNYLNAAESADVDITAIVKENVDDISWSNLSSGDAQLSSLGFLTHARAVKAVYALSNMVDKLFEKAAVNLNLKTMVSFVRQLCFSATLQLFPSTDRTKGSNQSVRATPLLFRLGELVVRCARSSERPLLHIAGVWNIAAPYLAKAAGHKDQKVARQAVSFIHDTITAILTPSEDQGNHAMTLWNQKEPKYFRFNEALLLPFERAMQLETCDPAVQDQIVSSISQLVEASPDRIASGWRPLFSALRHVSFSEGHTLEKSPVLDVLNAFFNASRSPPVFASAAHDCIKCLLKLLTSVEDNSFSSVAGSTSSTNSLILKYLEDAGLILMKMHHEKVKEKFHNSANVDVTPSRSGDGCAWRALTVPQWISNENKPVEDAVNEIAKVAEECFGDQNNSDAEDNETKAPPSHCFTDDGGLLPIWFALMDGLTTSVLTSHQQTQPKVLKLLCDIMEKCWTEPGPKYCCHILLHSCLPTLYAWITRLLSVQADDDATLLLTGYKHMFGTIMEFTADVILRHTRKLEKDCVDDESRKQEEALLQNYVDHLWFAYFNLCVACIQTRKEPLAKLGCACLRHIIATVGNHLTSSMLDDVCQCMSFVVDDCLSMLNNLITAYDNNWEDGIVIEVMDCVSTVCDASCVNRVFQAGNPFTKPQMPEPHHETYISFPRSPCKSQLRVSLCELACDVSSLHLLMNCIEHMLLNESRSPWQQLSPDVARNEQGLCNSNHATDTTSLLHSTTIPAPESKDNGHASRDLKLPMLQSYLEMSQVRLLSASIVKVYVAARNFDRHKDLQQLVQKLGKFYSAAHLYQFAALAFDSHLRIILSLCSQSQSASPGPVTTWRRGRLDADLPETSLSVEDLLPRVSTRGLSRPNPDDLKSDSCRADDLSWAHASLSSSLCLISFPWSGTDDAGDSGAVETESFVMIQENQWESDESARETEPEPSDDKREEATELEEAPAVSKTTSPSAHDYMAYVKRSDSQANGRTADVKKVPSPARSKSTDKKSSVGRRIYSVAGEKTIGRLINAYKRHKQQLEATTVIAKQKTDRDGLSANGEDISTSENRSRSLSDCSLSHSSVVGVADSEMEREAWCLLIASVLRLLITAPDPVLSKLLPIVYQPLASLARCRLSVVTYASDSDVGHAFHQWLLRVGELCNLTVKNSRRE